MVSGRAAIGWHPQNGKRASFDMYRWREGVLTLCRFAASYIAVCD
jgi:hypothetical protein